MKRIALIALLAASALAGEAKTRSPKEALAAGIEWLKANQTDGVWTMEFKGQKVPSAGFTAVALAPFAASIPAAERAAHPILRKSVAWLLERLDKDGAIRDPGYAGYENYLTSATLMALSIINDPAHAEACEKMKAYLLSIQRREEGRNQGGFGYNKQKGADLSNAQYTIEALRAAGIPEDHEAMVAARRYLERVQNRSENESNAGAVWEVEEEKLGKVKVVPGNDGSAGYEPGVSKAGLARLPDGTYVARGYGSMTYALLKCYILAGVGAGDDRVKAAIQWVAAHYTWEENPGFQDLVKEQPERKDAPYFGLFYYYMSAAKALRAAGVDRLKTPEGEKDWRADLAAALVRRQAADGSWANEWSQRWEEGSPVLSTAYATIALQEILSGK